MSGSNIKQYTGLDLLKFICSILVVLLHINLFQKGTMPYFLSRAVAEIGVPCFFIMSGFFFFSKFNEAEKSEQMVLLKNQEKRLLTLLAFWIVPFFITYDIWWIKEGRILTNILEYIRHILFGGEFFFLWYFVALIVALFLCYYLVKLPKPIGFAICLVLYIIGTLGCTYNYIFDNTVVADLINCYNNVLITTRNGLFFGLPCVYLGYLLSDKNFKSKEITLLGVSAISLFVIEVYLCIAYSNDFGVMQLSTILLSVFAVLIFMRVELKNKAICYKLRKLSVLIYVIHPILIKIIPVVLALFARFEVDYYWYKFYWLQAPAIILISCIVGLIFIKASEKIKFIKKIM